MVHVIVHNSVSADGGVEGFEPDIGLHYEIAGDFGADVHLAGSDTLLAAGLPVDDAVGGADEPPRDDAGDARPLLVVVDSRGRIDGWRSLRQAPHWRDRMVALVSRTTPAPYLDRLAERHVDHIVAGDRHVDLSEALAVLERTHGATRVLVDSGGTLNGVLLRAGLVDEVSLLVHPCLVDAGQPTSVFRPQEPSGGPGIALRLATVQQRDGDVVWLRYDVVTAAS
ncbi:MAG TPA: dihydrofolate reductase family protein [Euzebyales bacterium]|nr:dihydrofolate reductase family protein [Euzebyales bacterium]